MSDGGSPRFDYSRLDAYRDLHAGVVAVITLLVMNADKIKVENFTGTNLLNAGLYVLVIAAVAFGKSFLSNTNGGTKQ